MKKQILHIGIILAGLFGLLAVYFYFQTIPNLSTKKHYPQQENFNAVKIARKVSGVDYDKTKGVIVAFKHWPLTTKEEDIILKLYKSNMEKTATQHFFKAYIFTWKGLQRNMSDAKKMCFAFEQISFVKYCDPNGIRALNNNDSLPTITEFQSSTIKKKIILI